VWQYSIVHFHFLLEYHIFHVVLQIQFYGFKVWRDVGYQSVDHYDQAINQVNSEGDTFSLHIWNGEAFCHVASIILCVSKDMFFLIGSVFHSAEVVGECDMYGDLRRRWMYQAPVGGEYCTTQLHLIDVQNCFPQYHGDSFLTTCEVCMLLNVSWVKVILVAHLLAHSVTNTHTHEVSVYPGVVYGY
jgi:hypothetical protein